ncbi:MAG: TetR/AcrR family transcriptional regulator [Lachnospiraceae bacterium]|jgi:AcrR family transcriptional regulator|nr:TetR/AcrR family transcriptional regulator [Lachnospiraceae bacterium]
MSKSEKQIAKESERNRRILETAFRIFVERKIEPVSMGEIAEAAGIGRASLFRYYPNKLELVIAVCAKEWKECMDELDRTRPISSVGEIPAIDRLIFTLDSYIDMYRNHKALLQYNDNFNYYVSHMGVNKDNESLTEFHNALYSVNTRLHMMYEKAKADHTFRTNIPEEEFMWVTVHTMMAACEYYAEGFIWGSEENRDYTPELLILKEMILNFVRS